MERRGPHGVRWRREMEERDGGKRSTWGNMEEGWREEVHGVRWREEVHRYKTDK